MQNSININHSHRVAIFGSCVSRDIFSHARDVGDLVLSSYYARCNLASLSAAPWVDNDALRRIASPFQRRMVKSDMDKSFIKFLENSEFDTLLIDFIDERFNLQRMENKALITLSNEYLASVSSPLPGRIIKSGSIEHTELWNQAWLLILEILQRTDAVDRVQISQVYWATSNTIGKKVNGFLPEHIETANRFLRDRYLYLKKLFPPKCFIEYPENLIVADIDHQWGESPFHFAKNFYLHTIKSIVLNINSRNELIPKLGNKKQEAMIQIPSIEEMVPDVEIKRLRLLFRIIIGGSFSSVKSKGFIARNGVEPIPLVIPMQWTSSDKNIEFNLHAWRFMSSTWAFFIENKSNSSAQEIFLFNIKFIRDWSYFDKNNKNKHSWYDMAVGIRAMHLAFMKYLANRYSSEFQDDDINFINNISLKHISWLSDQKNITKGNHAIYEIIGLRLLAMHFEVSSVDDYASLNMSILVDSAFDEYYVSNENSPFYHKYNIDIFSRVPPFLFPNIKNKIANLLQHGPLITKWLTAPDGFFYRIGDTEGLGALLTAQDAREAGFKDNEISIYRDLGKSGYQIIRSHPIAKKENSFSLVFRGTPASSTHSHSDALSFIFFQNGEEIFADPGKFTYEYGDSRNWFASDFSHNTAGLEGNYFYSKDIHLNSSNILPIKRNIDHYIMTGQVRKSLEFLHSREILFFPGEKLVVRDNIENNTNKNTEIRYLIGLGFDYIGDHVGYLKSKSGASFSVSFSGNIEQITYLRPEASKAWISKTYAKKEETGLIVIRCPVGLSSLVMQIDLA